MKTTIMGLFALGVITGFSSCVSVERDEPKTRTTTTEETSISRPRVNSVETQTIRSY